MPAISDTQTITKLEQFGKPETDWQGNKTYTLPDGTKMTFTEGGDFVSKTLPYEWTNQYSEYEKGRIKALRGIRQIVAKNEPVPENYKQLYSPQDQQLIEQYEAKRSQIANDPELEESERQALYDKIDARISAIPHISPQMQEPTPQQRFESSIVTDPTTGLRGTFDPKTGKFAALEADTVTQKQKEIDNERKQKLFDSMYKAQLDPMYKASGQPVLDEPHLIEKANMIVDMMSGKIPTSQKSELTQLDSTWISVMQNLSASNKSNIELKPNKRKPDKQLITDAMTQYVIYAAKLGISQDDAKSDFLQRYQNEVGGGPWVQSIPKLTPDMQHEAQITIANKVRVKDPMFEKYDVSGNQQKRVYHVGEVGPDGRIIGAFAGGEIPTSQGATEPQGNAGQQTTSQIPKGLEPYWDSMSEEEKQTVLQYLAKGGNINEVIKRAKK
jgi:hypothetical protein